MWQTSLLSILTKLNFVAENFSRLSVVFVEIDETVKTDKNDRLFLSLTFPVGSYQPGRAYHTTHEDRFVRRGVSKDSGARIKTRLGKPSCKSCSTNCWSSVSSRNHRPVSGVKSTQYPKAMVLGDLLSTLFSSTLRPKVLRAGLFQTYLRHSLG